MGDENKVAAAAGGMRAVELYFEGQETSLRLALEEGFLYNLVSGQGKVWALRCPSGISIPAENLRSLRVSLSGATLEKESCSFGTAPSGGTAMRIFFHSGITVTGYFGGPGAEHDLRRVMYNIMRADGQVVNLSPLLRFEVAEVFIDFSSVENLLHSLGVNVEANTDPWSKVELKDPGEMSIRELKAEIAEAGLDHRGLVEKREFVNLVRQHRDKSELADLLRQREGGRL